MLDKSANSNKQMVELKKSSHHIDLLSTSIIFWNWHISYETHFNKFVFFQGKFDFNSLFCFLPTKPKFYLQSACLMCSRTNGKQWLTMSSPQQVAKSIKHTPAALHGFQSSSSSNSSCLVRVCIRIGTINCRAPLA